MSKITYPEELEAILAVAVSLGRARMLEKKQFKELRELDAAIERYGREKAIHS